MSDAHCSSNDILSERPAVYWRISIVSVLARAASSGFPHSKPSSSDSPALVHLSGLTPRPVSAAQERRSFSVGVIISGFERHHVHIPIGSPRTMLYPFLLTVNPTLFWNCSQVLAFTIRYQNERSQPRSQSSPGTLSTCEGCSLQRTNSPRIPL